MENCRHLWLFEVVCFLVMGDFFVVVGILWGFNYLVGFLMCGTLVFAGFLGYERFFSKENAKIPKSVFNYICPSKAGMFCVKVFWSIKHVNFVYVN